MRRFLTKYVIHNRQAAAGCLILTVWILFALLVPALSVYSYSDQNAQIRNEAISMSHWFGTDKFGRDLFTRVWYGAGISLMIGLASSFINGAAGIIYGTFAGYRGKRTDMILMRAADIIASVPSMLYVILLTLIFGAGIFSMILGLCVAGWINMARIVRGEVMRLKNADFIYAARLEGISSVRIVMRHILPNAAGPVAVNFLFMVPQAVFTEAFLSFLGIGLSAPAASLGTIIREARSQMQLYPSQMACPLLVLCVMLFALHLIGTALEEELGKG